MSTAGKWFLLVAVLLTGLAWVEQQPLLQNGRSGTPRAMAPIAPMLAAVAEPASDVRPPVADPPSVKPEAAVLVEAKPKPQPAVPPPAPAEPPSYTMRMLVTAYCPCRRCCGRHADGRTASGRRVTANGSKFVAADTRLLPFGTAISIPGYNSGAPAVVLDRGRLIKGKRLDVFFLSHSRAKRWGARWLDVTVYQ